MSLSQTDHETLVLEDDLPKLTGPSDGQQDLSSAKPRWEFSYQIRQFKLLCIWGYKYTMNSSRATSQGYHQQ